jgi:hypothetical protein
LKAGELVENIAILTWDSRMISNSMVAYIAYCYPVLSFVGILSFKVSQERAIKQLCTRHKSKVLIHQRPILSVSLFKIAFIGNRKSKDLKQSQRVKDELYKIFILKCSPVNHFCFPCEHLIRNVHDSWEDTSEW